MSARERRKKIERKKTGYMEIMAFPDTDGTVEQGCIVPIHKSTRKEGRSRQIGIKGQSKQA